MNGGHFFRHSYGLLYDVMGSLVDAGKPTDLLTVRDELQKRGQVDEVGGYSKLAELAALSPATANAPHHARAVVDASDQRRAFTLAGELRTAAMAGGLDAHPETADALRELLEAPHGASLQPLWLTSALAEEIPATSEYVEDVLQTGVLADIAGLPYLHKTALALELAAKVSRGSGDLLGQFPIKRQATVAYFWGDDSRAKELQRIQEYADANDLKNEPIAFYLNPGLILPDDTAKLRGEVKQNGYGLVVLDSLYNFAPATDWSDATAITRLYGGLKRICDEMESLTIVLVDHASKPSDANQRRHASISSFGSVFKAASVRCSITIEREGTALYVSAHGNNVHGFARTPAAFSKERLELYLVDTEKESAVPAEVDAAVLEYVRAHHGQSSNQIARELKKRPANVRAALNRLAEKELVFDALGSASALPGTHGTHLEENASVDAGTHTRKSAWFPAKQAESTASAENGTHSDAPESREVLAQVPGRHPSLYKRGASGTQDWDADQDEDIPLS